MVVYVVVITCCRFECGVIVAVWVWVYRMMVACCVLRACCLIAVGGFVLVGCVVFPFVY